MKNEDRSPSCSADRKKYETDGDTAIAVECDKNRECSNCRKLNILHIALSQKMGLTGTRSNANLLVYGGNYVKPKDPHRLKDKRIAKRSNEKAAKC